MFSKTTCAAVGLAVLWLAAAGCTHDYTDVDASAGFGMPGMNALLDISAHKPMWRAPSADPDIRLFLRKVLHRDLVVGQAERDLRVVREEQDRAWACEVAGQYQAATPDPVPPMLDQLYGKTR